MFNTVQQFSALARHNLEGMPRPPTLGLALALALTLTLTLTRHGGADD